MKMMTLCAALYVVGCSSSEVEGRVLLPQHPAEKRSFDTRLERAFRALSQRRAPVIVAVVHDGRMQVREFGALRADGIAPEETLIDLNSITKTITAISVATLVERGVLRLDETLTDFFVQVPADKRAITVHQLLTHSAGFRESLGDDDEPLARDAFVSRALASKLVARPGARYHYSNAGYGMLAAIIELRSGQPYESYLREVLDPLGLTSIGYEAAYQDALSMRSLRGETIRQASWGDHAPGWNLIGNGGLVANVSDFCRLRERLLAGDLVSPELLRLLHTPHIAEDHSGESWYGYGVVVQELAPVGRLFWHDGGHDAFSAIWADYTDQRDLIMIAGADSRRGDAFEAMELLTAELYDVAP